MADVTSRVLRVLRLFTPHQPIWTVDDIAGALEVSSSSAYRYVQDLTAAAFLDPVRGGYALGPALIELDHVIRHHDPLIQTAAPFMQRLLADTTQSATAILCRRSRDRVMCIHQEHGALPHRQAGYERGVAMPLFRGATSRVILANVTAHVQRRTYLENEAEIHASGLADNWKDFTALAAAIRQDGYAETVSEVTPGIRGIAAPVFQDQRLVACLSLAVEADLPSPSVAALRAAVMQAAQAMSDRLAPATLLVAR